MDFTGTFPQSNSGNKYILVMIDQFSKWVELMPTRDMKASTVCHAYYTCVICRRESPKVLSTDNGTHFKNKLLDAMCSMFKCFKAFSAPYYPEGRWTG